MSLTPRQAQVAALIAKGMGNKGIARETGLSVRTIEGYIQKAAERIPGEAYPREKLLIWFFTLRQNTPIA